MRTVITTTGIPRCRSEITPLQREILGCMIGAGIYSYKDLARHLGLTPWTLSKTLRSRRGNPRVLKKLARFLGKKTAALRKAA